MEMSLSHAVITQSLARRRQANSGFSILEVLVAITILAIGLSAMAQLVASSLSGTEYARYMALATTLTSEKMEDLNHWPGFPSPDPRITAGGGLTADTQVSTSLGTLNYYDDVNLASTNGQISETIATTSGSYQSIIHMATGQVTPASTSSTATGSTGSLDFHRRWLIEANPVVNGITLTGARRLTVEVTLTNGVNAAPITYQMSAIRQ